MTPTTIQRGTWTVAVDLMPNLDWEAEGTVAWLERLEEIVAVALDNACARVLAQSGAHVSVEVERSSTPG